MEPSVKILPNFKKYSQYIEDVKNRINPIMLSGLTDSGKVHFAFSTHFYTERPIVVITYNELQAKKIQKDLEYYTEEVLLFPKRETFAYDYIAKSNENYYQRMNVLNKIYTQEAKVIVTTIEAIMQKLPAKEVLFKNKINLKVGQTIKMDKLKEKLVLLGYERYDLVESIGQFSSRGGILDIALSNKRGVRIEFWGDEIDSIRYFDLVSQRSDNLENEVNINPVHEFVLEQPIDQVCKNILNEAKGDINTTNEDIQIIRSGDYTEKVDRYFNSFYKQKQTFLDYLPDNVLIFIDEASRIKARSENIIKDNNSVIKTLIEKKKIIPDSLCIYGDYIDFTNQLKVKQAIYLEKQDVGFIDKQTMHAKRNGYSFSYREVNFFRSSMDLLFKEIQKACLERKTVVLLGGNLENTKKLVEELTYREIPSKLVKGSEIEITPGEVLVTTGVLSAGFEAFDFNLLVISGQELFAPLKKRRATPSVFKQGETIVFSDLRPGDFVVHRTNGIGQFAGVNTIKADGIVKDYIKINYRDDDVLYIPTNQMDNIRKYIGPGESKPKLNRLGSKEWQNTKRKVKSNLKEIARELIELYAKRQNMTGYAFAKDTPWQTQFEEEFPYTETEDQLRCIEEVKKDMEEPKPMDRLLCGDVGYGKTEVAIRAAFKACMDQKQVAYLVPTTILANQQYKSFKERMEQFPIRVELLNRFKTKKEQEIIIKKLKLRRNRCYYRNT